MHSVTSNAVAEVLNNVSELKTLRDDGAGVIKYRTLGKIIIFSIHSKYTGIMSVSLSDANITCASFSEGMKTSLCWGGSCVGEAYITQDGTGIVANMPSSANGSGQIIAFLA